ncbi:hypothetical protein STENM223S_03647 [Streptomyces tendae]
MPGVEGPAGEGQFTQVALVDQQREALEAAQVGHDTQFGLGEGEAGPSGRVADVAGTDEFQGGAGALAVNQGDDRLRTCRDGVDRPLEGPYVVVHEGAVPAALGPAQTDDVPAQVHADGEGSARTRQGDDTDVVAGADRVHAFLQVLPEGPAEGVPRAGAGDGDQGQPVRHCQAQSRAVRHDATPAASAERDTAGAIR